MAIPNRRRAKAAPEQTAAERNLDEMLRHLDRDRAEPPPLVAHPSEVTREAIAIVRPWLLHGLLHLETFSTADLHEPIRGAQAELRRLDADSEQSALRARELDATAQQVAAAERACRGRVGVEISNAMLTTMSALRSEAQRERDLADGALDGPLDPRFGDRRPHPVWNERLRAEAEAKRSPKEAKSITRSRAQLLEKRLSWGRPKLAELIVASQHDWSPRPVQLAPSLAGDVVLVRKRLDELLRPIRRR